MAADPDHAYPVGVYGSVCVLSHLQTTGAATWFWQSLSTGWCGNAAPWPSANIRQLTPPNATFPGTKLVVDYDCSDQANEGSW